MNLSIKESAKAEEVIATVHIMSVDGKETTKNITLKIGGVKSDDTQTIAATTYELGLDDSGDLNAIVVDLKDAFSSLSAANAEEIYGVSTDRREEDWKKAIEEDKSYWNQVLLRKDDVKDVLESYCIVGFPHIILVDPEGKIVAKELRGDDLYNTVKKFVNGAK